MQNFASWFYDQPSGNDPNVADLQNFATGNAGWPFWSDQLPVYTAFITKLNPPNKDALLQTVARNYGRWESEQSGGSGTGSTGQIALLVGGIVIVAIVGIGLFTGFFKGLANTDQARGLVTFLFVLSTSGVILITTIAIFYFQDGNDIKNRFAYAKDLLTIVIGVLGTIMGFYFGQAASTDTGTIGISDVVVAPIPAKAGKPFTLAGTIAGGKPPYLVTIDFKSDPADALDATKIAVKNRKSENGAISETIPLPADAKKATLTFTVSAKDTKGIVVQSHGTVEVQP